MLENKSHRKLADKIRARLPDVNEAQAERIVGIVVEWIEDGNAAREEMERKKPYRPRPQPDRQHIEEAKSKIDEAVLALQHANEG
jgi:hypothetical protein